MFAYCNNNPATYEDPTGALCVFAFMHDYRTQDILTTGGGGGGGGTSSWGAYTAQYTGHTKWEGSQTSAYCDIQGGQSTASVGRYECEVFSVDSSGITFVQADWTLAQAGLEWEYASLTLMDVGSAEVFLGATREEGIALKAMASLLSASAEFRIGPISIELDGYVGGIGADAGILVDGFTFGFAAGVGGGVTIRWDPK